jgi:hypothetical protein
MVKSIPGKETADESPGNINKQFNQLHQYR